MARHQIVKKVIYMSTASHILKMAKIFPSCRLLIAVIQFLGTVVLYMNRVNISFAIVCMTEDVAGHNETHNNGTMDEEYSLNDGNEKFAWSRQTRGFILSSFFIGYLITQVPTGWLLQRTSAKWLLFGGMVVTVIASFLSPVAARGGWGVLVFLQIVKGLACGCFYPCLYTIVAHWAPAHERSRFSTLATCGSAVGSIIGFLSAGFMCKLSFAGGWPSIFYIYAVIACFWLVAWAVFVYDHPTKHPFVSSDEKLYVVMETHMDLHHGKKGQIPWKAMLFSPPVLALWTVDFTYHWLWYTALTLLPTFIHDFFHLDIRTNGAYSSLPYLANLILALVASWIADTFIRRKFKMTRVRKLMVIFSSITPALLVIVVAHLDKNSHGGVVACLTLAVGFLGFARSGNLVNRIDLAPKFVGIVQAIANSLGTVAGILAPLVTTAMVPDGTQKQWQHAFYLGAALSLLGAITFIVFGSGEVQPWASSSITHSKKKNSASPEAIPLEAIT